MLLRDATEADAAACAAIYAPHVLGGVATFEETPPDAEEMLRRMRAIAAEGRPWIVAALGGRIAGYAYASSWNDRSAYRFTVQDSVYVDGALHRQGVGRALLSALIERCAAAGMTQMMAAIGGGSPASVALHEASGFLHVGRAEKIGLKFGVPLDVVYMRRAL